MKNKFMKGFAALCAVVLLAAAVMELLPDALAEQYKTGDAEISAPVKSLEINWTSGKVNIGHHSGSSIIISEKAVGRIRDDQRMCWALDGDTLRIQFQKPGFHLFSFLSSKKELTVLLPEDSELKNINLTVTSADIIIPTLRVGSLKLKATSGDVHATVYTESIKGQLTSGDIELQVMNQPEEIEVGSTSGNITLEAAGARDRIKLDATSGSIHAAVNQTRKFKASSTSGNIHAVIGEAKETEISSTSGRIVVEIARMDELDVHNTSGGVTAFLPATPGYTARITTTSGHIDNKMSTFIQGKDFVCGDGSGKVKIHTTSGNIMIDKKAE